MPPRAPLSLFLGNASQGYWFEVFTSIKLGDNVKWSLSVVHAIYQWLINVATLL